MNVLEVGERPRRITRRGLLVGGGVGIGLAIGYALWPRTPSVNLVAADGESIFNPWIKIGRDGHVTAIIPQLEAGQGAYTAIPQIIADELGADWRTIAVEPAPINPAYGNPVFAEEIRDGIMAGTPIQATGFSSSIRAFAGPARQAAAAARILLCKAAAARWDEDWENCETDLGFVIRGNDRLRFGDLAEEAASLKLPSTVPLKQGGNNRLIRHGMARLDIPAKLDGTANFAADIRFPDHVFASIRQGPPGTSTLAAVDRKAGEKIPGVLEIIEAGDWVAAVATNWWAADQALAAMRPRFRHQNASVDNRHVAKKLDEALNGDGQRIYKMGDVAGAFAQGAVVRARYDVGFSLHAAAEPMAATARIENGHLQLWMGTQWPGPVREAAARATGIDPDDVTVHVTLAGGAMGRNLETEIAGHVAILAQKMQRPVSLMRSRAEEMWQDRFGPPASARMIARLEPAGRIAGWQARIAVPNALGETVARSLGGKSAGEAQRAFASATSRRAVEGAAPPYAIPALAIDHHPADIGIPTGITRGAADVYTAFFNESFIDELSRKSGVEPLSFRIALLGGNPRLAECLSLVAARAGWDGGAPGTGQGLACHAMRGSFAAVIAEARLGEDQRIRVSRLFCVADIGRIINPDLARQQIEGGLMHGMANAIGNAVTVKAGLPGPLRLGQLGLPKLADMPEVNVKLIDSREEPGGASEIAVPPVAPAIGNALFSATGRRFRSLPLAPEPL